MYFPNINCSFYDLFIWLHATLPSLNHVNQLYLQIQCRVFTCFVENCDMIESCAKRSDILKPEIQVGYLSHECRFDLSGPTGVRKPLPHVWCYPKK